MAQNVPAYLVFSNAALMDMAARQPRTMDAFMAVSGVGAVKAKRYGADFLAAIETWHRENGGSVLPGSPRLTTAFAKPPARWGFPR